MSGTSLKRPEWPRPAASAAIFRGGEVLLVERGKGAPSGLWSLPGGHIEPGEAAREAARREVGEETGIDAQILGLVDVRDVLLRGADGALCAHYVLAVYFGTWLAGEPRPGDDSVGARFVPIPALAGWRLGDGVLDVIMRADALMPDPQPSCRLDTGAPGAAPDAMDGHRRRTP